MRKTFKLSHLTKSFLKFLLLYVVYVQIGGILFVYIEEKCPVANNETITITKHNQDLCNELEIILSSTEQSHLQNNSSSNQFTKNISCILQKYCRNDSADFVDSSCRWTMERHMKWLSFSQATIFTIGYGEPTPKSTLGRMMTIVYALIGMPIALAMLGMGGQLVIHKLQTLINFFERKFKTKGQGKHQTIKVLLATILTFFLSLIGGCLISAYGHLHQYDSTVALYYWFQTITTIGYGDIQVDRDFFIGWRIILIVPYVLFTIFGLALMSALLNLAATVMASEEWKHVCCCKRTGDSVHLNESRHTFSDGSLPDMTASIKQPKKSVRKSSLSKYDSNLTKSVRRSSLSKYDSNLTKSVRKSSLSKYDSYLTKSVRKSSLSKYDSNLTKSVRKSSLSKYDSNLTIHTCELSSSELDKI